MSEKTGISFKRPANAIRGSGLDSGAAAERYSFQKRDRELQVGGGRIQEHGDGKRLFTSDLNSVITESRINMMNGSMNNKVPLKGAEPKLPVSGRNRVGHWDMYELASKIKDQINIEKLLEDKIIRKAQLETFELSAFQDFDLHSPEHLHNEK